MLLTPPGSFLISLVSRVYFCLSVLFCVRVCWPSLGFISYPGCKCNSYFPAILGYFCPPAWEQSWQYCVIALGEGSFHTGPIIALVHHHWVWTISIYRHWVWTIYSIYQKLSFQLYLFHSGCHKMFSSFLWHATHSRQIHLELQRCVEFVPLYHTLVT